MTSPEDKTWYRFLKVLYIFSYCLIPLIINKVWINNAPREPGLIKDGGTWHVAPHTFDYYVQGVFLILLTIVISLIIIRLIKIVVIYIITGEKPKWRDEFRKFF